MPQPWNFLRNSTIYFGIYLYSATYLLMVTLSTLWRSQDQNISYLFTNLIGKNGSKYFAWNWDTLLKKNVLHKILNELRDLLWSHDKLFPFCYFYLTNFRIWSMFLRIKFLFCFNFSLSNKVVKGKKYFELVTVPVLTRWPWAYVAEYKDLRKYMVQFLSKFYGRGIKIAGVNSIRIAKPLIFFDKLPAIIPQVTSSWGIGFLIGPKRVSYTFGVPTRVGSGS